MVNATQDCQYFQPRVLIPAKLRMCDRAPSAPTTSLVLIRRCSPLTLTSTVETPFSVVKLITSPGQSQVTLGQSIRYLCRAVITILCCAT